MKHSNDKETLKGLIDIVFKETKVPHTAKDREQLEDIIENWEFPANTSYRQKMLCVQKILIAYSIGVYSKSKNNPQDTHMQERCKGLHVVIPYL